MKKIISVLLLTMLALFAFASCGASDDKKNDEGNNDNNPGGGNAAVSYTVTVFDGETPISGAKVSIVDAMSGNKKFFDTNENGVVTFTPESEGGVYSVTLVSAPGYTLTGLTAKSFDENNKVTFNLAVAEDDNKVTYTIYVKDTEGDLLEGVIVQMCIKGGACKPIGATDSEGKVTCREIEADWQAQITGYSEYYDFDENRTVTIIIELK